jgi:hypothetical protein
MSWFKRLFKRDQVNVLTFHPVGFADFKPDYKINLEPVNELHLNFTDLNRRLIVEVSNIRFSIPFSVVKGMYEVATEKQEGKKSTSKVLTLETF